MKNTTYKLIDACVLVFCLMLLGGHAATAQVTNQGVATQINPYESVGIAHNDGLRTVIQTAMPRASGSKDIRKKAVEEAVIAWATAYSSKTKQSARETSDHILLVKKMFNVPWWPVPQCPGPYFPYPPDMGLGPEAFAIAKEVYPIPQNISPDAYQAKLRDLEKRALPKKDDPRFQRVLMTIAIARHSAEFWTKEFPKSPIAQGVKINWWGAAAADAVGGLVGSLGGPVGAAVTAAGASAENLISQMD